MSSTNKTSVLGLNSWLGTDKPQRADFNSDNEIIDNAFGEHVTDTVRHITNDERKVWNSPYYMGSYIGDGTLSRTVKTKSPFVPSFMLVFGSGFPLSVTDFDNTQVKHYCAFANSRGATLGLEMSGINFIVKSTNDSTTGNERTMLNALGKTYIYIFVR